MQNIVILDAAQICNFLIFIVKLTIFFGYIIYINYINKRARARACEGIVKVTEKIQSSLRSQRNSAYGLITILIKMSSLREQFNSIKALTPSLK